MVTYLAGGDGGAGGGGACWRTDVDEGGVLVLSVRGGRGGRGTVRAAAHLGGSWTGQGRQGARQLQQVVGSLGLLLGSVVVLAPASIWGEISNF